MKKDSRLWADYRRLKNKVTSENRKLKKKYYYEKLCQNQSRNESWNVLKSLTSNTTFSSTIPLSSKDNFSTANEFNFHFANVANDVFQNDVGNSFQTYNMDDMLKENHHIQHN